MFLRLPAPEEKRFETVQVNLGDYVQIYEWNGIIAKGIVQSVTLEKITIESGSFIDGCYPQCDYSQYENQTVFEFEVRSIARIDFAEFESQFNPKLLLDMALNQNYCGSEELVVSPLFHRELRKYLKNPGTSYFQYPIRVDQNLQGIGVYATPNEETKKHLLTPKKHYSIEFYKQAQFVCSTIFNALPNEYEAKVEQLKKSFENQCGAGYAYRVKCDDRRIEQGTKKLKFAVTN